MRDFELLVAPTQSSTSIIIKILRQPVTEHFTEQGNLEIAIIADPLPLAEWFAANWWRLRWEPEKENLTKEQQLDWDLSHKLTATGSGYIWPDIRFASDDFSIHCTAQKTFGQYATIRFSRQLNEWLDAENFEAGVDRFVAEIAKTVSQSNLSVLWQELLEERNDSTATDWRKIEAKAGYDPDEAPHELIEGLQKLYNYFGKTSVEELSSENHRVSVLDIANSLLSGLSESQHTITPDLTGLQQPTAGADMAPWKQAAKAAAQVRKKLGIKDASRLSNELLLDYLSLDRSIFNQKRLTQLATAGLKKEHMATTILLSPARETTQRFALARLLGDCIFTLNQDDKRLLSVTSSKTSRQKFQRAFAQELLCPYEGLLEVMDTDHPNEENLEKMAEHYQVSTLVIGYTFENKYI